MRNFKYLTSFPYTKQDNIEDTQPLPRKAILRQSLDFQPRSNTVKKPSDSSSLNFSKDLFNTTTQLPFFRPKSPLERLGKSLRISKLSRTSNIPQDSTNKTDLRVSSALTSSPQAFEIVNPQTPFKGSFLIIRKSEVYDNRKLYHRKTSNSLLEKYPKAQPKTHQLKKQRIVKTINIKEIDDREWINKKKSIITNEIYSAVLKSNGMKVLNDLTEFETFKYYVGKGNNSKMVRHVLGKRLKWIRVKANEINSANFIWTEWIDAKIVKTLATAELQEVNFEHIGKGRVHIYKDDGVKKIVDLSDLGYQRIIGSPVYTQLKEFTIPAKSMRVYNKIEGNHCLSNKKELFFNLRNFCISQNFNVFDIVPLTFHIIHIGDEEYNSFERYFKETSQNSNNIWIVKPGEDTNRGTGISICFTLDQIKRELNKSGHTLIVQKYIENPFLINKRKFDIRIYALITCFNGVLQGYFYREGYIRTSSCAFVLNSTEKFIHLTNDAVQKHSEDYGKYETGNKMSYIEFQKYLDSCGLNSEVNFIQQILPKIKEIIALTIKSTAAKLNTSKKCQMFEVFGYDFLLDTELKPWLLEANTNPCLDISAPLLARIIPAMLDNTFLLTLDSIFPAFFSNRSFQWQENKFDLIYHSEQKINNIS